MSPALRQVGRYWAAMQARDWDLARAQLADEAVSRWWATGERFEGAAAVIQESPADEATPTPVSVLATASTDEVTVGETFTIEVKALGLDKYALGAVLHGTGDAQPGRAAIHMGAKTHPLNQPAHANLPPFDAVRSCVLVGR